jgi:hypothetical protein
MPSHSCFVLLFISIRLIDWCLTPTLAVFQLYRGMNNFFRYFLGFHFYVNVQKFIIFKNTLTFTTSSIHTVPVVISIDILPW